MGWIRGLDKGELRATNTLSHRSEKMARVETGGVRGRVQRRHGRVAGPASLVALMPWQPAWWPRLAVYCSAGTSLFSSLKQGASERLSASFHMCFYEDRLSAVHVQIWNRLLSVLGRQLSSVPIISLQTRLSLFLPLIWRDLFSPGPQDHLICRVGSLSDVPSPKLFGIRMLELP